MNLKQLFKKHYSRLVAEAIDRSLLCGLVAGFATNEGMEECEYGTHVSFSNMKRIYNEV